MNRIEARKQFQSALLADEGGLELDRAALLIAAEEYPALEVESYLHRLDLIAVEAKAHVMTLADPAMRVMVLAQFLSEELGFRGNAENYYDARNSFLNEVIDRRTGIPITLSVVYLEIARRLGLSLYGVGLPGHFILKYVENGEEFYLDPFHRGQLLTEAGCREIVEQMYKGQLEFRSEFLAAVTRKQILTRMLQNLKMIYTRQRDHSKTLGVIERILLIEPDSVAEIRDRGLVQLGLHRYAQSLADLEEYLRLAPSAPDAAEVKERITQLRQKQARLN